MARSHTALLNVLDVSVQVERTDDPDNPPKWADNMNAYDVMVIRGKAAMTLTFYQGKAHFSDPSREDVIHCLMADRDTLTVDNFEDWAYQYGYDSDSISALNTYNKIVAQTKQLEDLFSADELALLGDLFSEY